jgi:predicted O-methyltransferase YrrM
MGLRSLLRHQRRQQVLSVAAPQLQETHLRNCQVIAERHTLLEHLPKRAIVAEVGVAYGDFSREILARTQPKELHLIDLEQRWADRFADRGEQVRNHLGDSSEQLAKFPNGYFDWIYMDADHRYEMVKRDTDVAKRKVKPRGLLVFNDYTIYDAFLSQPYGVPKTVHELCREENWEMTHLALEATGFFDVVLRRMEAA